MAEFRLGHANAAKRIRRAKMDLNPFQISALDRFAQAKGNMLAALQALEAARQHCRNLGITDRDLERLYGPN